MDLWDTLYMEEVCHAGAFSWSVRFPPWKSFLDERFISKMTSCIITFDMK